MAENGDKDLLSKLSDRGEEALSKIAEAPGGSLIVDVIRGARERMDDVQKRLRGVEKLEAKVAALEKRLATLEKASKPAPAAKRTTAKRAAPKRPPAAPKPEAPAG